MRRSFVHWTSPVLALTIAACSGPVGAPATSAPPSAARPTAKPTPSSAPSPSEAATDDHLVSIGDRSLWFECEGEGSPTVILESGLGGDHRTWEQVQPELAASARVCTYDRAGVGESDPAVGPRTASDAVEDLASLFEAAEIDAPYVLVGFSYGGAIAQLYAAMHPDEVAGLVLVESNHPLETEQFEEHLTASQIEEDRAAMLGNPEQMDVFAGLDELQAAGSLPNVPLVVVTAGVSEGWPPGWDSETFDALRAAQQADLATMTDQGSQVIAETSTHHIPSQEPATIVAAVEQVLRSSRD